MCVYNSEWPHNFTEPKLHLNQFSQIKCSYLETELIVMKKFEQNYQIQVQIQLVRNTKSKSNPNSSKNYKSAGFISKSKSMFISANNSGRNLDLNKIRFSHLHYILQNSCGLDLNLKNLNHFSGFWKRFKVTVWGPLPWSRYANTTLNHDKVSIYCALQIP